MVCKVYNRLLFGLGNLALRAHDLILHPVLGKGTLRARGGPGWLSARG